MAHVVRLAYYRDGFGLRDCVKLCYCRCGGASARVIQRRIMRTPHFVTDSMQQAQGLSSWLISHFEELKSKASEVSKHCKLIGLEPWFVG